MGSLVFCFILSAVALTQGEQVLINDIVDGKLALNNQRAVEGGKTSLELGTGFMNPIGYEGGVAIGLDSLKRTGDCAMEFSDTSIKYTYVIGQGVHAVYFRNLQSPYGEGSGYYRAFDSTINYGYTVNYGRRCQVNLNALQIQVSDVELCVASKCLNSTTDDSFAQLVKTQLNPGLNKILSAYTQNVQDSLNNVYCHTKSLLGSDDDKIGKGLYVLSETLFE